MEPILTTVTSKGQVTIPVEVRRLLGIEPKDKVALVVEGHDVLIRRYGSVIERTAGMRDFDRIPGIERFEP
jgi:AbrB family looped-hinge helix DNA binding protein